VDLAMIDGQHGVELVMAGLVLAIHALLSYEGSKAWMPGTRPGMTWRGGS